MASRTTFSLIVNLAYDVLLPLTAENVNQFDGHSPLCQYFSQYVEITVLHVLSFDARREA